MRGRTDKENTHELCVCVAVCVRHWSRVFWVCASLCVSVFVFLLLWMHATLPALCACVCVRSAGSAVLNDGHGGRVMQHGVRGVRHRAQQAHTCYTHCPSNAARHCLPLQAALHDRNYSYASQCTPLHFSEPCHQIVVLPSPGSANHTGERQRELGTCVPNELPSPPFGHD